MDGAKEKAGELKDKASDMLDRDEEKEEAGQGTHSS